MALFESEVDEREFYVDLGVYITNLLRPVNGNPIGFKSYPIEFFFPHPRYEYRAKLYFIELKNALLKRGVHPWDVRTFIDKLQKSYDESANSSSD